MDGVSVFLLMCVAVAVFSLGLTIGSDGGERGIAIKCLNKSEFVHKFNGEEVKFKCSKQST